MGDANVALLDAAREGREEDALELLTRGGADVNTGDIYGSTALSVACRMGHEGVVKLLLRSRADVNRATVQGATPLYVSCAHGKEECVELLRRAGADTTRRCNGKTPFEVAELLGRRECADILRDARGVDPLADRLSSSKYTDPDTVHIKISLVERVLRCEDFLRELQLWFGPPNV